VPRLLVVRARLRRELRRRRPDVLVPIDFGAFNVGLCAWARRHLPETRILYYFPPGSWRRSLKGTTLAGIVDRVATPFPWSEWELRRFDVDAHFVGHPLLDLVRPSEPAPVFAARHHLDLERPVVGILPGSRPQEIEHILPVQLQAAAIVHKRVPAVQFLLGLAPTVERAAIVRAVEDLRRRHAHLRDLLHRMEERLRDEMTGKRLPPLVTTEGTLVPPDELAHLKRPHQAGATRARRRGRARLQPDDRRGRHLRHDGGERRAADDLGHGDAGGGDPGQAYGDRVPDVRLEPGRIPSGP
jgi:hypothetical protein